MASKLNRIPPKKGPSRMINMNACAAKRTHVSNIRSNIAPTHDIIGIAANQ